MYLKRIDADVNTESSRREKKIQNWLEVVSVVVFFDGVHVCMWREVNIGVDVSFGLRICE